MESLVVLKSLVSDEETSLTGAHGSGIYLTVYPLGSVEEKKKAARAQAAN